MAKQLSSITSLAEDLGYSIRERKLYINSVQQLYIVVNLIYCVSINFSLNCALLRFGLLTAI
ncbi:hypothetical protein CDL12_29044 [Handroanthus impetiginosus]|uniref:Uncharacterized protein n=1 Tax=Handroanthus impetiginosus TaxID=429701 RepID=A0A2G9FZH2_9LAMI|nr:hypothetical protein CDL12_29044 [Handroanthus impetiginosus]